MDASHKVSDMINFIRNIRLYCSSKKNPFARLSIPSYAGRHAHEQKAFLILANGPTLSEYSKHISMFIHRIRPITIGCNFLDNLFVPDYHIFVNRKRFASYASSVSKSSKLLLSRFFHKNLIRSLIGDRPYEKVMAHNLYPAEHGSFEIVNGIPKCQGATVGLIAAATAVVMGATDIFFAGLDGYSETKGKTHYYHEPDNKDDQSLQNVEHCTFGVLEDLSKYLSRDGNTLRILTPTAYAKWYDPDCLR